MTVTNRIHAVLDRNHVDVPRLSDLFVRAGSRHLSALDLDTQKGDPLHSHLWLLYARKTQIKETEGRLAGSMGKDRRAGLLQAISGLDVVLATLAALETDDIRRYRSTAKLTRPVLLHAAAAGSVERACYRQERGSDNNDNLGPGSGPPDQCHHDDHNSHQDAAEADLHGIASTRLDACSSAKGKDDLAPGTTTG